MDRNIDTQHLGICVIQSLSARRAWIEMLESKQIDPSVMVALRKESVDRNFYYSTRDADWVRSLSARRAWIEIWASGPRATGAGSLSARRAWIEILYTSATVSWVPCRSPQGERG